MVNVTELLAQGPKVTTNVYMLNIIVVYYKVGVTPRNAVNYETTDSRTFRTVYSMEIHIDPH